MMQRKRSRAELYMSWHTTSLYAWLILSTIKCTVSSSEVAEGNCSNAESLSILCKLKAPIVCKRKVKEVMNCGSNKH